MSNAARRLAAVDAFRGIAVLAVLLSHLQFSLRLAPVRAGDAVVEKALPDLVEHVLAQGAYGVNLFLVISGFCIHMQWARSAGEGSPSFGSFWKRRLRRLYPPYLVALVGSFAGLFLLFGVIGGATSFAGRFGYASTSQLLIDVVVLLLLAQNLNGANHRVGNGPFWTLALEEQLYLLYFPLLWLRRRAGWTVTLLAVSTCSLAWRFVGHVILAERMPPFWTVVGPSRWIEWTLGALAVEGHLGRVALPAWSRSAPVGAAILFVAAALHIPSFILSAPTAVFGDALYGLAFFVLLNAACRRIDWPGPLGRPLVAVGIFSYSLYLTHEPVIVAVKQAGLRLALPTALILILRLALPLAVAYLFFWVIERRFLSSGPRTASS